MKNYQNNKDIGLWELYITFFKIGMTTFGGGYAMVPLIHRDIVEEKCWIEEKEFLESIALTNSLPGPLATNCAVYTGYRIKGYLGSFMAVLGIITPSIIIILTLAIFLTRFNENKYVVKVFNGLRPAVVGLIGYALIKMAVANGLTIFNISMAIIIFSFVFFLHINPVWAILAAALSGLFYFKKPRVRKGEKK